MIIDHIGIVVRSLEKGILHWKDTFGYSQMTDIVVNTRQKVKVVFLSKKQSVTIKLIEPVDEKSPVYGLSRRGGGLHHLCFMCKNLKNEISNLKEIGCRILVEPQPGEAFENENIAFIHTKYGYNIELIDTEKRAKLRNKL